MGHSSVRLPESIIPKGYEPLELLHEGKRALVYRALRSGDQISVIIKTTPLQLALRFSDHLAFRNQFIISQSLDHPGIIQILSLEPCNQSYALVMEDVQGIPLSEFLQSSVSLQDGLMIALQLAEVLHYLAQQRVLHKDIKPANILIHPQTLQIKLIDFGIASLLPRETQEIKNPNVLEGTLAYMAPEQTGRMNRGIDFRSDFYGLGVTLFELFAGQLPFQSDQPVGWLHCHIAQVPPSLTEFGVPIALANIVAKLLAKNAEDRYQSALGLKHDLERCLTQLTERGEIEPFEVGKRDVCDRFLIPEKLYGRAAEIQTLLDSFDRVSQGSAELMLVAGFSGIGKTAVINEVHKPITQQNSYFIKGKFDQFNRNIPFLAFVQAFRSLMSQLLGESDADLATWKAKILKAVGESGQVLIEVIPELERIIDVQPAVPKLSGTAAQNRFNVLFGQFIHVFTTQEHPLVIFLDDLQWADSASINLLKLLINESAIRYLLVLGAYRNNEVFPAHPLMLTLDEMRQNGSSLQTLTLDPLAETDINQLVADTFRSSLERSVPLSQLIYQKTRGNPFFTAQFLQELHGNGSITFDPEVGCWQCDLPQVGQLALTDDIAKFMEGRLQKLPEVTQDVLKLAACIGNHFTLEILAVVCEKSQDTVAADLWRSLQAGFVIPENETYKFFLGDDEQIIQNTGTSDITVGYRFLHDRVQQAAYAMIQEEQTTTTHYKIGQLLLEQIPVETREERIFELVSQLNNGISLITDQGERDHLAQLNLIACRKARNATAYQTGLEYAKVGLLLLGNQAWQRQYDVTLALHDLATELASLCGHLEQMETFTKTVLSHAVSVVDCINVYQIQITSKTTQNELKEAVDIGKKVLQDLGLNLPDNPSDHDVQAAISEIDVLSGTRAIQDLFSLPTIIKRETIAMIEIANLISSPAYLSGDNRLYTLLITQIILLSIRHGNTPGSAFGYALFGFINCNQNKIEIGIQFSQLALDLVARFGDSVTQIEVLRATTFGITFRKFHLRETLPACRKNYLLALETGKLDHAGMYIYGLGLHALFCGQPLSDIEHELYPYIPKLIQLNQLVTAGYCQIIRQVCSSLLGMTTHYSLLSENVEQETKVLTQLSQANDLMGLSFFHLCKLMLCYLFEDVELALEYAAKLREQLTGTIGMFNQAVFYYYDSLSALAGLHHHLLSPTEVLKQVRENQTILQDSWAHDAPMNFQHKVDLVEAETSRFLGQRTKAIELYDRAIAGAKANEYLQEEALAHELAAKFYLDWGKEKVAAVYMQDAYGCYTHWGAKAKTEDLKQHYPNLLQPLLQPLPSLSLLQTLASLGDTNLSIHSSVSALSNGTNLNNALDFATILKSSQALSDRLHLDELLEKLTQMMLQNSGADRLVLLLPEADGSWHIRATTTSEATYLSTTPLIGNPKLPVQLIQYVQHTQEILVVNDLDTDLPILDGYLQHYQPRSVLCLPILYQGNLRSLLYLQNQFTPGVFTCDRITILNFLCSQAAIALENARLFSERLEIESALHQLNMQLDQRVQARTQELSQTLDTLKTTQASLVEAEKMAALGTLVAGMAHEINTPIGTSITVASTLADESEVFVQAAETGQLKRSTLNHYLSIVRQCTQLITSNLSRASDLIQSFKQIAVDQSHRELRTFNLKDYIEEVVTSLQPQVKRSGHRLHVTGAAAIMLTNDPGVIAQVITNLVTNSIKHAYSENKVGQLHIHLDQQEQQAMLTYRDDGCGIPPKHLNKIYEPFFTTARHRGGTGLGLNIVYNIVTQSLKGTIQVNSQVGQGTTFAIAIPYKQD